MEKVIIETNDLFSPVVEIIFDCMREELSFVLDDAAITRFWMSLVECAIHTALNKEPNVGAGMRFDIKCKHTPSLSPECLDLAIDFVSSTIARKLEATTLYSKAPFKNVQCYITKERDTQIHVR